MLNLQPCFINYDTSSVICQEAMSALTQPPSYHCCTTCAATVALLHRLYRNSGATVVIAVQALQAQDMAGFSGCGYHSPQFPGQPYHPGYQLLVTGQFAPAIVEVVF